jgi:hypothetical protein
VVVAQYVCRKGTFRRFVYLTVEDSSNRSSGSSRFKGLEEYPGVTCIDE